MRYLNIWLRYYIEKFKNKYDRENILNTAICYKLFFFFFFL